MSAPVAVALMAIQAVFGFISNIQAGQEQAAASKANARAFEAQAVALEQRAGLERKIAAEKAKRQAFITGRVIAQQRADYGASGVDIQEGSPLEVIAQSAAQGKLQELDQLYAGELNAYGFLTEAAKAKTQASFEKYNANLARAQGFRKGFSSLLGGGAQAGLGAYQTGLLKGVGGSGGGFDFVGSL